MHLSTFSFSIVNSCKIQGVFRGDSIRGKFLPLVKTGPAEPGFLHLDALLSFKSRIHLWWDAGILRWEMRISQFSEIPTNLELFSFILQLLPFPFSDQSREAPFVITSPKTDSRLS